MYLRIVAWLPGLVREHWPRGKVEVISMMSSSSSSSSSTSTVSEIVAWASSEGLARGCDGLRTGEKALLRPESPGDRVTAFS